MRRSVIFSILLATALTGAAGPRAADGAETLRTVKRNSVQLAHDTRIQAQRAAAGIRRGAHEFGNAARRDTSQARAVAAERARLAGRSIRKGARQLGTSVRQGAGKMRQSLADRQTSAGGSAR